MIYETDKVKFLSIGIGLRGEESHRFAVRIFNNPEQRRYRLKAWLERGVWWREVKIRVLSQMTYGKIK